MPNTKRCFCDDWEENIHMTHPDLGGEMSIRQRDQHLQEYWRVIRPAKLWNDCPWCTAPLAESKEEWEKRKAVDKALVDFVQNQEDTPPEFNKVIDDNFWELLA